MTAYRKVNRGEPLVIPAQTYNGFIDVANAHREGRLQGNGAVSAAAGFPEGGIVVPIKNSSGADRSRFDVLRISGAAFTESDNDNHFKNRPYFTGAAPDATLSQRFAILQEPISSGKVGKGMLFGVTACNVDIIDADDQYCDAISGDSAKLRSFPWGCAEIIYKPSGTGTKLCYVTVGSFVRRPAIGKADSGITQGLTGTVSVWSDATTTLADTGQNVTAYARYGDVTSGEFCELIPHSWGFECVQQPCA